MINSKLRILFTFTFVLSLILFSPTEVFAVVQSLNGQTGNTQTFSNDTNVTISSSSNVHTLGWSGLLGISRGGTNASSFTNGSVLFFNGTSFAQNNSNFFWDNTNHRLGIGTSSPTKTLDVNGDLNVTGNVTSTNLIPYTGATSDIDLGNHSITFGQEGGNSYIHGTNATTAGVYGSALNFKAGDGAGPDGHGGGSQLVGGDGYIGGGSALLAGNSNDGGMVGNGGDVYRSAGINYYNNGNPGKVYVLDPVSNLKAILGTSSLASSDKTFTFPNASGTFGLLQSDQTWSGLNQFQASSNSTIYVGSSSLTGCIALGDSDGSGITYITANNGVLSASSTKPSTCQ